MKFNSIDGALDDLEERSVALTSRYCLRLPNEATSITSALKSGRKHTEQSLSNALWMFTVVNKVGCQFSGVIIAP